MKSKWQPSRKLEINLATCSTSSGLFQTLHSAPAYAFLVYNESITSHVTTSYQQPLNTIKRKQKKIQKLSFACRMTPKASSSFAVAGIFNACRISVLEVRRKGLQDFSVLSVVGIVGKPLLRRLATWDAQDCSASFLGSIASANFELLCQHNCHQRWNAKSF